MFYRQLVQSVRGATSSVPWREFCRASTLSRAKRDGAGPWGGRLRRSRWRFGEVGRKIFENTDTLECVRNTDNKSKRWTGGEEGSF